MVTEDGVLTHHDLPNELPVLPRSAGHTEPGVRPERLPLLVHPDERHRVDERQEDGGEAHTPGLAVDVEDVGVPLGGSVELPDELDAEPVCELLPDVRPQPVAPHDLHIVTPVLRGLRGGEQVATDLPDILSSLSKYCL